MPTRTTFDSNVGDKLFALSDADRHALFAAFRDHRFSFYLTGEVFEETLCLAETSYATQLLPGQARWLLNLLSFGRFLADWREISAKEVAGNRSPFASAKIASTVRSVLKELAAGRIEPVVKTMAMDARKRKEANVASYRELQDIVRDIKAAKSRTKASRITFDEFRDEYWARRGREIVLRFLREGGAKDPESRVDGVLKNLGRYPYTQTHMTVHVAILWRYYVDDRRVHEGDVHDAGLLVQMVGLDVLVSDDKALRETFPLIHSSPKRILTFDEFMAEVRRSPS